MILTKEFVSLTTVAVETVINEKCFKRKSTDTEKIELIGYLIIDERKIGTLKKVHFEKKNPKS